MDTKSDAEAESKGPLVAWLALSQGGAGLSVAVAFVLTAIGWVFLPGVEEDPMNALSASVRDELWFVWAVLLSTIAGWIVGFGYDTMAGQGWWSPAARKARATNPDWMGDAGARRRRLIVIVIGLGVLFMTVVTAFALAR